jgi:hypothetical protein
MKTAYQILSKHVPDNVAITPEMVYAAEEFSKQETIKAIQELQTEVHKITGDGQVMRVFNAYLGISAT